MRGWAWGELGAAVAPQGGAGQVVRPGDQGQTDRSRSGLDQSPQDAALSASGWRLARP
jgi:hypothetical protein